MKEAPDMADGQRSSGSSTDRWLDHPLPLDTARESFAWLVTGPEPLSLDCRPFLGLPNRMIPLDELRDRMLRRRCPRRTRDAVWADLVQRSRNEGATWTLACAGMALPALASATRWLAARFPDDPFDVHAEVLAGFLSALATIDLDRPRVLVRLRWAAYRAGFAALCEALDAPTPVAPGFWSTPPRPPWGHPDLVLARAVRAAVLTRTEADLIGSTRLDEVLITDWADRHEMTTGAAYKARRRAEYRLIAFLRDQDPTTDPDDPVAACVTADLAPGATERSRREIAGPSRSVASVRNGAPARAGEKGLAAVSKTGPDSGLLGCGSPTPASAPTPSPEARRCA
ncbi:hypothetical protein ACFVYG_25920 [Streptomyces sp. NPDC058256]|uniref:hypothetical protein n=1 Tax=Streptomyces sp. NPDC058256 TaxID=3346408 RepID=UPI0036E09444